RAGDKVGRGAAGYRPGRSDPPGSASRNPGADPGQDLRQNVVRADVDGPFGLLRRVEQRDVQPHLGLGDAGPPPRVRRAALVDDRHRGVEVDQYEVGPVRLRDGGELPAVLALEQQVVIDQGLPAGQDRGYLPAGDVLDEVVLGGHRRAGRRQAAVCRIDLD